MLSLRHSLAIFNSGLESVEFSKTSCRNLVQCGAKGPRPRYPRVWKTKKRIGTISKSLKLVECIKGLSNVKEEVYGALDSFIAWEIEFPLITVKKALKNLENEKEWKRIIQVTKWMLSKGQGRTMGSYYTLLNALAEDGRLDEAEVLWRTLFSENLESMPRMFFERMISIYYHKEMHDKMFEIFADMEELGIRPTMSIVNMVGDVFQKLDMLDKYQKLRKKYPPPKWEYRYIKDKVKKAVSEVLLGPYYFMAGRLNFNEETKRMELICNNGGVIFVSAKSRISIKDLGNLSQPNPSFSNLIHRPGLYKSLAETAVFTIQVTRFECGGFSLGFMTNHAILDGKSASEMFHNLASICRGEGLKTQFINNDRTCIKARIPPQIQYPHKEYVKLAKTSSLPSSFTSQKRTSPSQLIFSDKYIHELFPFSPKMLRLLKEKAMIKCSTFEAIVAHIWGARTKAVFDEDNYDQYSTVLFAVDIRGKITPPLPDSFAGNAVITAFATARARDLIEKPLCFGVELVREARERVGNEYIRSVIDWLEVYKGIPASCDGSFYVSAWWKLPFREVDFGYGKPKHAGPIVSGNDEFVLLLADEINCEGNGMGINVWMGLEKEKMERFISSVFEI